MRKKISKYLMLLAATVGMGWSVSSCKDTNEDLMNDVQALKTQIFGDGSSTSEALQAQVDNLRTLLTLYKAQLDAINSCDCDKSKITTLENTIAGMQTTIAGLNTEITNLQNNKADKALVTNLQNTVNNLQTALTTLEGKHDQLVSSIASTYVAKDAFNTAINNLQTQINNIGTCSCDLSTILTRLSAVETAAATAQATANAANTAAQNAQALADSALTVAQNAAAAAAAAQTTANQALTAAQNAQTDATNALTTANAAKKTAESADSLAKVVKGIADLNTTNIQKNADAIAAIKLQIASMSDSLKTAYDKAADAYAATVINKGLIDALDSATKVRLDRLDSIAAAHHDSIDSLRKDIKAHADSIANLRQEITNLYTLAATNLQLAKNYADEQIAVVKATLANHSDSIATNAMNIKDLQTKLQALTNRVRNTELNINKLTNRITTVEGAVDAIKGQITSILSDITGIKNDITDLQNADSKINERIDSVASLLTDLAKADTATRDYIRDSVMTKIVETIARVAAIENSYVTDSLFSATVDSVCQLINANKVKIAAVDSAYQVADSIMMADIDSLANEMTAVKNRVDSVVDALNTLTESVDSIKETLAKMVTGVTIQGTYNPMFGSISLPTGLNTNVLVALYGEAANDIYFPTDRTGNYVRPEEALTAGDMAIIGASTATLFSAGDKLVSNAEDNAGTLYVTINPNTVDYTGLQLSIENSQAEASKIKLGTLKESNKKLAFGFTRASGNGFYEAPAHVEADDIESVQKANFDVTPIKDAAKEILEKRQNANFDAIAADMYDVVTSFSLDANAVKCAWTENGKDHAVYSNYGLAATAVKPLSFESLNLNVATVPGYEQAMSFIDRFASTVKGKINDNQIFNSLADLQQSGANINIRKAELINVDSLANTLTLQYTAVIDTTITVKGKTFSIKNVLANKLTFEAPDHTVYTIDIADIDDIVIADQNIRILVSRTYDLTTMFKSIMKNINGQVDDLNTMIMTIVDFLEDVNQVIDDMNDVKAQVVDGINSLASRLRNVLNKGNKIIADAVNGINGRLQPVMVLSTSEGTQVLSMAKSAPSIVSGGSLKLIPTTWTMELIVPVFKKHIAVTNVFKGDASAQGGDATCTSLLTAANGAENMNTVVDANVRELNLTGLTAGYTYEFAYSALDYHGKIATKKYYVTIQ